MPTKRNPPTECANCGATIPRSAKACPECGADERTGWRENADSIYDGLDLPEEAFEPEGDPGKRRQTMPRVNGLPWYWWAVGVGALAALIAWVFGWR